MSKGEISLYFSLVEGKKADLEVVTTAVLHWLEAARAAAREIEPSAQIQVDLVSANEGSLRFNTILNWAEDKLAAIQDGSGRYPRLRRLAIALVIFVPTVGIPTYDFYFGEQPSITMTEEERNLATENNRLLRELLDQIRNNPEIEAKRRIFFRTLERDPSISGVGIAEGHNDRPLTIVPSNQFAERSGLWALTEDEPDERTTYPIVEAALVSPVLVPTPRSWSFQPDGLPEFKAIMRDQRFLRALDTDHVKERLRTGIRMTLRLEVKEKKIDGAWSVKRKGRSVVEVISPKVG